MRNSELGSILDVEVKCPVCKWSGSLGDTEPDADGDGSPGCPKCLCNVITVLAKYNQSLEPTT